MIRYSIEWLIWLTVYTLFGASFRTELTTKQSPTIPFSFHIDENNIEQQ